MTPYRFTAGSGPLLVSMPHDGTHVPPDIAGRLTEEARPLPDTDWHVGRLYDFLDRARVSVLQATVSRYVVDLNRPPDGAALYPGRDETGVCPTTTFAGQPLYRPGQAPDAAEIAARVATYWQPYHDTLGEQIARLVARHGVAILWEAHTIKSRVPRFFGGTLPDLTFGTADGASAAPALLDRLTDVMRAQTDFTHAVNATFKGGYITRAYGRPETGCHAVQLELVQATYMDEAPPFTFDEEKAGRLRPLLARLIDAALKAD